MFNKNRPRLKSQPRPVSLLFCLKKPRSVAPPDDYFFLVVVFLAGAAFGEGLAAGFLVAVFLAAM